MATPCQNAIIAATKDSLSPDELRSAFDRVSTIRRRLEAAGDVTNLAEKLRSAVQLEADKTKIAAALQRKHAALNAIVRDRLDTHVGGLISAGLTPEKAILSVMEGSPQGIKLGRVSVQSTRQAYDTRFLGGMISELQKDKPYLLAMKDDNEFSKDIVRELAEIKEGGKPGITKNKDAQYVAGIFAKYSEMSRTELNRLGGNIGKLDGWAGPQKHDDLKISKVSEREWADFILPKLDLGKTFPDAVNEKEVIEILKESYTTIITGMGRGLNAAAKGERVGPANLAKTLGKSRILHFKDANAWLSYNDRFGHGNVFSSMLSHQQRAAQTAAQMHIFGPNPEIMLASVTETQKMNIRNDPKLTPVQKNKQLESLEIGRGGISGTKLANALLEMQGMTMTPSNTKMARIGSNIRAAESMAKLGGAVITAMPTDTATSAAASMFRGGGFWNGLTRTLTELTAGRSKPEVNEITSLLGESFDDVLGEMVSAHLSNDGIPGRVSKLSNTFFKWSGLTGWTERARGAASRVISSEMAMRAAKDWGALPKRYKHVLELNGINEAKWGAIREAKTRLANGREYITPDAMDRLPDNAIEHLISDRMAEFQSKSRSVEQVAETRVRYLDDARRDLFMDVARFFADETNYGVVETDAASRRIAMQGTRPGTVAGEVMRFMMQFKGFPIAFSQRIGGRALFGATGATKGQRMMNNIPHMGTLLASLTVAGYMSMAMKDAIRGQWPPRDPSNPSVLIAAMLQGGALGLYGDFLFGEANRFGNSALETAAGPVFSEMAKGLNAYQKALRGDSSGAEWLNLTISNTPYANLWFAKPAMDMLFLNSMRESASPGYRARQERRLQKDYGQSMMFPSSFGG